LPVLSARLATYHILTALNELGLLGKLCPSGRREKVG